MTDYWNEPPEPPDVPECCDEPMTITPDGAAHCAHCDRTIAPEPSDAEYVAELFADYDGPPLCRKCADPNPNGCELCDKCGNEPCRHGNPPGECATCDHESDLAYDAARELRTGGRR